MINMLKQKRWAKIIGRSGFFDKAYYLFTYPDVRAKDVDPIVHYIKFGAKEGRNPSDKFDTKYYLASNPDINADKINPLLHYILHGRGENRDCLPFNLKAKSSVAKVFLDLNRRSGCLITCWLGSDDPLIDGLVDLYKGLSVKGVKVSFLVSSGVVKELLEGRVESNITTCSLFISKNNVEVAEDVDVPDKYNSLLDAEAIWTGRRQDVSIVASVYLYWKKHLTDNQIKHVLVWGSTAPMSKLFLMLCQDLGIESTIMERGHFNGTLQTDSVGQFGFGVRQRQLINNKLSLLSEGYKKSRMQEILDWIYSKPVAQYAENNKDETEELQEILTKSENKKIVLFLGANDCGSGMARNFSRPCSNTWFESTQDALDSLVQVLPGKFDDVLLVIKPHPSAKLRVSDSFPRDNHAFASYTSIIELIKVADVCITTTSTVLGYCVALKKPTLQFGITDSTGIKEVYDVWHPSVISSYLRDALGERFFIEQNDSYSEYVLDLFDSHLIKVSDDIPARLGITDLALHIFNRVYKGVNTYDYEIINNSAAVSKSLYSDISGRDREYYDLNFIDEISERDIPELAIVIPVYDDLEGLIRCVEGVVKYRSDNNGYDVVMVWDCGPKKETIEYCRSAAKKYGIDLIENRVNIGFSGTVNKGILKYKNHDIILLNSDTIVHADWAVRMQKAAYVNKAIGSVNPLSNNATLNNVPFPAGAVFPKDAVAFVEHIDAVAKNELKIAVEVPVSHGFCVFIKRSTIDIVGLFDEYKFGKGHGEDNEYSMRLRSKGLKCITTTNVYVGHDGSTSFKEEAGPWKLKGRQVMKDEFPFYMTEIKDFFNEDPIKKERQLLHSHYASFFE